MKLALLFSFWLLFYFFAFARPFESLRRPILSAASRLDDMVAFVAPSWLFCRSPNYAGYGMWKESRIAS